MKLIIGLLLVSSTALADNWFIFENTNSDPVQFFHRGVFDEGVTPEGAVCKSLMNGDQPHSINYLTKKEDGLTPDCDLETLPTIDTALKAAYDASVALAPARVAAIAALKVSLVSKTWDAMTVAERKVATGQIPTDVELGL